jgi:cobalt/nickel transport system permease protein
MSRLHIETALHEVGRLDDLATRDTAAVRLDPRAKLVATLAFVAVVASFGRLEPVRLVPLAAAFLVAVPLCDVPWRPLLVRLALASPFALGVAVFEPFLDRAPALAVSGLSVSRGEVAFLVILAKFGLSLGAALLLVATTGFDAVCAALGKLGVPRVFVAQLSLTYRYLFVLGDEASRMVRAHNLRAPGLRRPTARTFATLLGHLLVRAMDRAERIHRAMQARGFDGRLPVRRAWTFRAADALFVTAAVLFLVGVRLVDVSALVGLSVSGALR